ncbi:homocysteine S-methyltransferase family protein [Moheibacter lacus]|uniref:Methionine synthase n=1 Tax=Moheibacter lacus TaxID=2745851 RepID=A0A838ZNM4_9FLAO|nr:homocysteine S-methyltransferase family protein [Moheibacter lacus]MBA5628285.1 homocysteine S-methyltransferase family protein [Moheibacter lacus]
MNLTNIIKDRILILDGAMGTMIQRHNLTEEDYRGERFKNFHQSLKGNNDLLSITQPDIIKNIHLDYLKSGADIIETNTFNANRISMIDYDMVNLVEELNIASAKLALEAAAEITALDPEKPRFVAGSLGPTNRTASISPDVNDPGFRNVDYDELVETYKEQTIPLLKTGVHAILVETIFDTLNAKAAFFGIMEAMDKTGIQVPLMASGTITDRSGRTLSGQTTEAFLISLSHIPLLSIGLNCALGATDMIPYVETLADHSPFYVSVYPNAGLPNAFGGYDESPEIMLENVKPMIENGWVNIIGGCCGTTPEHIKAIAEFAKDFQSRKLPELV